MDRDQERELYKKLGIEVTSAYSDEPNAVCGGGKPIAECETSQEMFRGAKEHIAKHEVEPRRAAEGEMWTVLAWLGRTCATCTKVCDVSEKSVDGYPTGLTRIRYVEHDPTIPVINIDAAALTKSAISAEELERFKQDIEVLKQHITGIKSERSGETESTPEQAKELLDWLVAATSERGVRYRYTGDAFGKEDLEEVPREVAKHMSEVSPLSLGAAYELYATREKDYRTGEPRSKGMIANVMFSQREFVDRGLIYATHVNYHIVSDEPGILHLERHVTASEHGFHKVLELHTRMERQRTMEGREELYDEVKDELQRMKETYPLEKAAGILTVTEAEAQQIIDFCRSL